MVVEVIQATEVGGVHWVLLSTEHPPPALHSAHRGCARADAQGSTGPMPAAATGVTQSSPVNSHPSPVRRPTFQEVHAS